MRTKFKPQMTIGSIPIGEIKFDIFSRHQLTPIMMALQYLYVEKQEIVREICRMIEKDIAGDCCRKLGRIGLNAWEIFVLGACRLGCNMDFDELSDTAGNHKIVRQMMELDPLDKKRFPKSTIQENWAKLSVETLREISNLVVNEGHQSFRTDALDQVRGDSYVLQKNIHYPTDVNLILDGIRKIIHLSKKLADDHGLKGWGQYQYHMRKARELKRRIDKIARSKKKKDVKDAELKAAYLCFLEKAQKHVDRSLVTINQFNMVKENAPADLQYKSNLTVSELQFFIGGIEYISDLAYRRVVNGEKIPNDEKAFSLFEPGTELINRGKQPNPIEFGHRVLIIQDKAGFIIHASVMGRGQTDEKVLIPVMKDLQKRYNGRIRAASFDKGFWLKSNLEELSEILETPVLPKKGKRSEADSERENAKKFGKIRKWHSGIESAIHGLVAGNGLRVCRDKGTTGYDRYFAMGVLSRNLQTLGTYLLKEEREKQKEGALLKLVA